MTKKIFLKNSSGFTLVEIMISIGLLSMVGLGVMQTVKQSSRLGKAADQKISYDKVLTNLSDLMKNPKVCKSTLFGKKPTDTTFSGANGKITEIILLPSIDSVQAHLGDPNRIENIAGEMTTYNTLLTSEKKMYLQAGCSSADLKPCTYGRGGARMLISEIKIMAFEHDNAPYNNKAGTNLATLEVVFVPSQKIGRTSLNKAQKESSYGQEEVIKRIRVPVRVDSNNLIYDCISELVTYTEGTCDQHNGKISSDYKCKNIHIQTKGAAPANADHPNAIWLTNNYKTEGNHLVTERVLTPVASTYMEIGPDGAVSGKTDPGSLRASGNGFFVGDLSLVEGDFLFGAFTTENTRLSAPANSTLQVSAKGDLNIGTVKLGDTILDGDSNKMGINKIGPTATVHVLGDARFTDNLLVNQDVIGKKDLHVVDGGVDVTFKIEAGILRITGGNIKINGQNNFNNHNDNIASRRWVYDLFLSRAGNVDGINSIIDDLKNKGGVVNSMSDSAKKTRLLRSLCTGMKNYSYSGGKCRVNNKKSASSGKALQNVSSGTLSTANLTGSITCSGNNAMNGISTSRAGSCVDMQSKDLNSTVWAQIKTKTSATYSVWNTNSL